MCDSLPTWQDAVRFNWVFQRKPYNGSIPLEGFFLSEEAFKEAITVLSYHQEWVPEPVEISLDISGTL
jgi:hypothetical protein